MPQNVEAHVAVETRATLPNCESVAKLPGGHACSAVAGEQGRTCRKAFALPGLPTPELLQLSP